MISALARVRVSGHRPLNRFVQFRSASRRHTHTGSFSVNRSCAFVTEKKGSSGQDLVRWVGLWMALPFTMKDQQINTGIKSGKDKNGDVNFNKDVDLAAIISQADDLLDKHQYEELYKLISSYKHVENDELLWRLARAYCASAKLQGEKGDTHKRKALMEEGFSFAQRALRLNDQRSSCHSWYATMLHYTSEFHGIKTHYLNAFTIRDHYEKAVSLDPSDAVSLHSLGYWCFEFAHLPWYQKKILAVLFRSPPNTTFEQALDYFYKAEEASPGFFSMNLVMAGRAHHHLHQYDKARDFFTRAAQVNPQSPDERQAHAKATEMLKKMDHHHH